MDERTEQAQTLDDRYTILEAHPELGKGKVLPGGVPPLVDKGVNNRFLPQVVDRVLEAVALGLPKTTAYQLAGVSYQAVVRWIKAGEEAIALADRENRELSEDPDAQDAYGWFVYRLAEAEALAQEVLLRRIREAGEETKNWAANAWLLERIHPDLYGRRNLEISGPGGGPVQLAGPPQVIEVILRTNEGPLTPALEEGNDAG